MRKFQTKVIFRHVSLTLVTSRQKVLNIKVPIVELERFCRQQYYSHGCFCSNMIICKGVTVWSWNHLSLKSDAIKVVLFQEKLTIMNFSCCCYKHRRTIDKKAFVLDQYNYVSDSSTHHFRCFPVYPDFLLYFLFHYIIADKSLLSYTHRSVLSMF